MAHGHVPVQHVTVPTTGTLDVDVAGRYKVADDPLHGSLGDADVDPNVGEPAVGSSLCSQDTLWSPSSLDDPQGGARGVHGS